MLEYLIGELNFGELIDGDTEVSDCDLIDLQVKANAEAKLRVFELVAHGLLCQHFFGHVRDLNGCFRILDSVFHSHPLNLAFVLNLESCLIRLWSHRTETILLFRIGSSMQGNFDVSYAKSIVFDANMDCVQSRLIIRYTTWREVSLLIS